MAKSKLVPRRKRTNPSVNDVPLNENETVIDGDNKQEDSPVLVEDKNEEVSEEGASAEEEEEDKIQDLGEGFYIIEAIRQKRVRKGQLQYLVKWKEWPESANTWEPADNIENCFDLIEEFEEKRSAKSGRKRKGRKSLSSTKASNKSKSLFLEEGNDEEAFVTDEANQADEDDSVSPLEVDEGKEKIDYDPLGTVADNEVDADGLQLHSHLETNGLHNEPPNDNQPEKVVKKVSTGAKRRKSGSVKKFEPGPTLNERTRLSDFTLEMESTGVTGKGSGVKPTLTKVLKPLKIAGSVTGNVQDVEVTFTAMRSDGVEVVVDNKFLRANNPLLLLDYYEQHLKHTFEPAPGQEDTR